MGTFEEEGEEMKITICDICSEEIKTGGILEIRNVQFGTQRKDYIDICKVCEKEILSLIVKIKNRPKEQE